MGKRSAEEEKAHLLKKIRKLQKKVQKLPDSDTEGDIEVTENIPHMTSENEDVENLIPEQLEENVIEEEEEQLETSILEILGAAPVTQSKGPNLHKEIADRWMEILKSGLKKEEKEEISKNNMPFDNCPLMTAPKLNPEVGAALNDIIKKRDYLIENRQKQISVVLSSLGTALQLCVKENMQENKIIIIKKINEACRLLCDSMHWDTKGRRSLILSVINKNMKEPLTQTDPQTYLFGENLTDKIRTAKSVHKSGQDLNTPDNSKRFTPRQNTATVAPKNFSANKTLNWRGPPHPEAKVQKKVQGGPTYSTNYQYKKKEYRTAAPPVPRRK